MANNLRRKAAVAAALVVVTAAAQAQSPVGIPVEFTFWGGTTTVDIPAGRETASGLRLAQIAFLPNANWRYWFTYDNTLTLDNFHFAQGNDSGEGYMLGAQYHLAGNKQYLLEAGIRHLEGDIDQTVLRGEYVNFMPSGRHWKLGTWIGAREDDRTEWVGYFGYGFPISNDLRLEPTVFYSRNGVANQDSWRVLLAADYMLQAGLKINAGLAVGNAQTTTGSDDYIGGHVMLEIPFAASNKAYFLVRREQAGQDNLWNLALGVTFSMR
jgi:hypothetical protein